MKHLKKIALASLVVASLSTLTVLKSKASDHDDGEMELKGRNLNLTDLYAFREDWQTGNSSQNKNMILIMNTNPRSLGRQQYFFSTKARYEFHLSRVAAGAKRTAPTGSDDVTLRLEFGAPDANNRQDITLTSIKDGISLSTAAGKTTTLAITAAAGPQINNVSLGGNPMSVFAGLREDSFFFDVQQFFKVRGALASSGGTSLGGGFRLASDAQDFTTGYNVNSIALRVPIAFLQSSAQEPVFDVWETISIPE